MFTARLDRSTAARLTLGMGAIAVGAVAVGAWAMTTGGELPAPPPDADRSGKIDQAPPDTPTANPTAPSPDLYASDVASALSVPYKWKTQTQEPDSPKGEQPKQDAPHEAMVRYLGSMLGLDRPLAIVAIDGDQHVLAEGATSGAIELVEVGDGSIVVRRNGVLETVQKAAPSEQTYTLLAGAPGGDGQSPIADDTPGATPEELRDAARNRMKRIKESRERHDAASTGAVGMFITPEGARVVTGNGVVSGGLRTSTTTGAGKTDDRDQR